MHGFRKKLVSSCVLLLVATVAVAATSTLLEHRAANLLGEAEALASSVDACPGGRCAGADDIVAEPRELGVKWSLEEPDEEMNS